MKTAAREAGLDPFLVLAVIRQESYFDDGAVSRAGAVGLMQIMPKTGRTLARSAGVGRFEKRMLFDPEVSIRMGSRYLGEQMRTFASGQTREVGFELGLAAYNAGPSAAHKWVRRFPLDDPDAFVERIPYKETRLVREKGAQELQHLQSPLERVNRHGFTSLLPKTSARDDRKGPACSRICSSSCASSPCGRSCWGGRTRSTSTSSTPLSPD